MVEKVTLGAVEASAHSVVAFDDLSVTVGFDGGNREAFRSPLVKGSPFASAIYTGASSPQISTRQTLLPVSNPAGISPFLVNGAVATCNGTLTNVREMQASFIQSDATWLMFFLPPATVQCISDAASFSVTGPPAFDGVVRMAVGNNCTAGTNVHHCPGRGQPPLQGVNQDAWMQTLRAHSHVVPTGGKVDYNFEPSKTVEGSEDVVSTFTFDVFEAGEPGSSPVPSPTRPPSSSPPPSPSLPPTTNGICGTGGPDNFQCGASQRACVDSTTGANQGCYMDDVGCSVCEEKGANTCCPFPTAFDRMMLSDDSFDDAVVVELPLLMLTMPHHRTVLDPSGSQTEVNTGSFRNIRGLLKGIVGSTWTMRDTLPDIDFWSRNGFSSPAKQDAVRDALMTGESWPGVSGGMEPDRTYEPALNYQLGVGDTYFSGKMLARMGQIITIADELGEEEVVRDMTAKLGKHVSIWLEETSGNPLLYDEVWGGVIACGCQYDDMNGTVTPFCRNVVSGDGVGSRCPSLTDQGFNFGNGYYNDHHFHYGYHVYAAAVVAKYDRDWAEAYFEKVLLYVRDYANPSSEDDYFPVWRHFDSFNGFSWAIGTPLANGNAFFNGRNQESTSEAVFSYYAVALFGKVLREHGIGGAVAKEIEDVGKHLMSSEIRGAQTYWHVYETTADDVAAGDWIYPDSYTKNGVVGILWQNLVQYQTFFGGQGYLMHGIQQIPYSPVSEALLPKEWVEYAFPIFEASCSAFAQCAQDGWLAFVKMQEAILDPESAWDFSSGGNFPISSFSNNNPGGNGNSLTNTLYWIATRRN